MRGAGKLFLFVVIVLLGGSLWFSMRRTPQRRALDARAVATQVLAEELVRRQAGTVAVIISNPFADSGIRKEIKAVEQAGIRGLNHGFGSAIQVAGVVFPEIRAEARDNPRSVQIPDTTTPLSFLIADDAFDRAARTHAGTDLVVSLIGLPANLDKVQIWREPGPPKLAFLFPDLRMVGDKRAVEESLRSGKIAGFILYKPDGVKDHVPVREDVQREFENRFLLVTAETFDTIDRRYPRLFDLAPFDMSSPSE